jgi:hypothetical protein
MTSSVHWSVYEGVVLLVQSQARGLEHEVSRSLLRFPSWNTFSTGEARLSRLFIDVGISSN